MIVGFIGHKGSGKDTAAAALPGAANIKMADPLKEMLRALYRFADLDEETIERKIEGDLKEEPCPILLGKTPRFAMQRLGTEWRNFFGKELWSNLWLERVGRMSILDTIFCTDVRFHHEANAIRGLGGLLVHVDRPGLEVDLSHQSEREMLEIAADIIILNDGTVDQLHERVRDVCEG